ncbi:MAG: hypothetical protein LBU77_07050 [Clostridiales bacterium]|jgi:hypothetical protein|nr:hypothetical protein [Clostridiales bacterium]
MQAVNGYLEDGRFTPLNGIKLPRRLPVMMVFNEADAKDVQQEPDKEQVASWLERLRKAVDASMDEDLPDLPPRQPMCAPLDFEHTEGLQLVDWVEE